MIAIMIYHLLAIQKATFMLDNFFEIKVKLIKKAAIFCIKQPNYRNFVVLHSIYNKIHRLKAELIKD